ncbi:MAG: alpha-ketoglutarate-dependent dioxygenase AlkB [Pseudomonadota bacterium]|jgi:alkylated DNA repair protein (DNA oxidative demethylase)
MLLRSEPVRADFSVHPEALTAAAQRELLEDVLLAVDLAPFYRPVTPGGRPMSVMMTNLGAVGWFTDKDGYRYVERHPVTGAPWPPMPASLIALWNRYGDPARPPDACLVNLYREEAKMSLHQDKDEADFTAPVVSVSLGDTAVFRLGGLKRGDPTTSLRLRSGDVCVLAGAARLAFHGVDRVLGGSSQLVPGGGRINLTLRRARS